MSPGLFGPILKPEFAQARPRVHPFVPMGGTCMLLSAAAAPRANARACAWLQAS